jgi:hypothetical protein
MCSDSNANDIEGRTDLKMDIVALHEFACDRKDIVCFNTNGWFKHTVLPQSVCMHTHVL